MDTVRVEELLKQGKGYKEISEITGEDKERVRHFARSLGDLPVVKRSPWRSWEEEVAKKMLENGKTFEDVSKVLVGRSPEAIKDKQYHSWRVQLREDLWRPEEEEKAKSLLEDGAPFDAVASVLGRSCDAVKIRNGWKWKVRVPHGDNLLSVDNFLDAWSPVVGYVLGFIVSDGNVNKNGRGISLAQSHDFGKEHLEKILPLIGGNIYGPNKADGYCLTVYSERLNQRCQELGIPPKKSLVVKFPDVPEEYLDHFVRGVFDGDGCVRDPSSKKRGEPTRISMQFASGSQIFRAGFIERVKTTLGIIGRESGIEVVYNHRDSEKLAEWMWKRKDQSIFLRRKYDKYVDLLKQRSAEVPQERSNDGIFL